MIKPYSCLKDNYAMPTHQVNLDALIQRQDFEAGVSAIQGEHPVFKLDELQYHKTVFRLLRKPDFQRTTNNWAPNMIVEFVRTFLDKELIPAIIIWHSQASEKIYLIDGAHRISALIAWVNDDYGDGIISRQFFGDGITERQRKLHNDTRKLIHETIGSYADLVQKAANNPENDTDIDVRRGRVVATRTPVLQRVEGDSITAEKAFLRINGSPAIIDSTELDVIQARRKPNTIATRALMQAGKGYQYWARFTDSKDKISTLAAEVYKLLFGEIVEISTQSPDVPRAGQPYSQEAFNMVLDMVNGFNNIRPVAWQASKRKSEAAKKTPELPDDVDGSTTLAFLERVKKIARFAFDPSLSGALGLDPAVYCYGPDKFYTSAYLVALQFAMELDAQEKLFEFTEVRHDFEEFIVRHKSFIKDISHGKGSRTRPLESLMELHRTVLKCFIDGRQDEKQPTDEEITAALLESPALKTTLKISEPNVKVPATPPKQRRKSFPKSVQQAKVLQDTLDNRGTCPICRARLAPFSRSKDHKVEKSAGGDASVENLQHTHAYCNSGYKTKLRHMAIMEGKTDETTA